MFQGLGFRVQGSDSEVRALRFRFLGLSHEPDLPVVQLAAPVILPACPVLPVPASNPAAQRYSCSLGHVRVDAFEQSSGRLFM